MTKGQQTRLKELEVALATVEESLSKKEQEVREGGRRGGREGGREGREGGREGENELEGVRGREREGMKDGPRPD